jgi:hypothetical protein
MLICIDRVMGFESESSSTVEILQGKIKHTIYID